jgi:hypothetical protein
MKHIIHPICNFFGNISVLNTRASNSKFDAERKINKRMELLFENHWLFLGQLFLGSYGDLFFGVHVAFGLGVGF